MTAMAPAERHNESINDPISLTDLSTEANDSPTCFRILVLSISEDIVLTPHVSIIMNVLNNDPIRQTISQIYI